MSDFIEIHYVNIMFRWEQWSKEDKLLNILIRNSRIPNFESTLVVRSLEAHSTLSINAHRLIYVIDRTFDIGCLGQKMIF